MLTRRDFVKHSVKCAIVGALAAYAGYNILSRVIEAPNTVNSPYVDERIKRRLNEIYIKPAYGSPNDVLVVPPAVVKPVIDGKYTPLENLEFTEIGKESPWRNQVKNEWDDAVEAKYIVINPGFPSESKPEWYIRLKHDEKYLYVLVDAVSDKEIGKVYKEGNITRDSRQWFDFLFDTMNMGKSDPGTPGVYWIGFEFMTKDYIKAGNIYGNVLPPGNLLPSKYYKYAWSLSSSPHSPEPHINLELAFDLPLLTKYNNIITYSSMGGDISFNLLEVGGKADLLGTTPIPEFSKLQKTLGLGVSLAICLIALKKYINKKD